MRGYILLRDNPYMAKSDEHGRFSINNLPTGKHTFQLWHERVGYLKHVQVGPTASDDKGRLTLTISVGDNGLPDVRLLPAMFEDD